MRVTDGEAATNAPAARARPDHLSEGGSTLLTRVRRLPVISWIWPERHSAEAGAGCGLVGGACCAGGAVVKGLGLASLASVSSFTEAATPYFIGASVVLMLAWIGWLFRRSGFQIKPFTRTLVRHGIVMGVIYAAVLGATMGIASATGVKM